MSPSASEVKQLLNGARIHLGLSEAYSQISNRIDQNELLLSATWVREVKIAKQRIMGARIPIILTDLRILMLEIDQSKTGASRGMADITYHSVDFKNILSVSDPVDYRVQIMVTGNENIEFLIFGKWLAPTYFKSAIRFMGMLKTKT